MLARKACQARADGINAPAVNLIDGQANANQINRDNDNDDLGFRPAVVYTHRKLLFGFFELMIA